MAATTRFSRPMFVLGCIFAVLWSIVVILRSLTQIFKIGRKAYFFVKDRTIVPEALSDPALGEHGYLQLSSVKLHYVAKGPEDAPMMLLIHGFPEFWYSWRHQLRKFGDKYRVVAIDMRGYGDSSKPLKVKDYTMDKLVGDIKEFVEGMGYEKCTVISHDWGGAVAWAFAHMHPEMVDKLITCNIPHMVAFMEYMQESWKQMLASWYIYFFQMPILPEMMLHSQDLTFLKLAFGTRTEAAKRGDFVEADIEIYKYAFTKPGAFRGPVNYYRAIFQHGMPLELPTEKVVVPTLMIWGCRDRALRKELAERSRKYAEDYRIKYIEAASHWVQQEAPDDVNNYIQQFLDGELE